MTRFLWERFAPEGQLSDAYRRADGALQALRRGAHVEPGSAPEMWQFYTQLNPAGHLTAKLRAEHVCLVTYGFHQQGASFSVQQPDHSFARALHLLRNSAAQGVDAIDAHILRLASSSQTASLAHHLRSIVMLMRATKKPIGFDYTQLYRDLVSLQNEAQSGRVRRRWGAAFRHTDDNTIQE